jgi:hypothetical protein
MSQQRKADSKCSFEQLQNLQMNTLKMKMKFDSKPRIMACSINGGKLTSLYVIETTK